LRNPFRSTIKINRYGISHRVGNITLTLSKSVDVGR
jgi:hypothetical protein